jgi:hypothetical protein
MLACQFLPLFFAPFLDLFDPLVLFLAACAGHIALQVVSINWWYGHPLPRRLLGGLRLGHAVLGLAGPLAFAWAYGLDFATLPDPQAGGPWRAVVAVYVLACWVVGLGLLPAVTLVRLLRRPPAALVSNHTRRVDVAAALGYKPLGRGKYRLLAALPGNQVFQVEFAERTLCLPRLPAAWDGLTVLHLSDLHLCGTPDREFYQRVLDECRAWDPDLVALTGDLVDTDWHHRWLVPLLGRLRWRVAGFAILGNHDLWHDPALTRRRLRRLDLCVLENAWKRIEVRGHPLVVIGHEGPWFRPGPDLTACPAEAFRLCLSHTPDNIGWARRHGIDLLLAGHNHGGQIRLPLLGPVFVPSRYSRRYDCGTFAEPPTLLHVSRGLAGQHPLRYHCRPEVTRLVLRRDTGPQAAT